MESSSLKNSISSSVLSGEFDQLTGLLNRQELKMRLRKLSESMIGTDQEHVICQIDIDSFKVINDVYGHTSGDALLCSITDIIKKHIRHEDELARVGNDEFALVIKNCSLDNALIVANNISKAIKNFKMTVDSAVYGVTVSIGVLVINEELDDPTIIMKNVDIACSAAKQIRDKIQVYHGDDDLIATYHEDIKWINKINNGIEKDHFDLFAQEVCPLTASEILNKTYVCEILLRMFDKDGNQISPGNFLPVASRHNLAARIDLMVIKKLLDYLQNNIELTKKMSMIMINLSGQSLGDERVLDYLNSRLSYVDFPTEIICFEITESEAIKNLSSAINFINMIQNNFGCRFALDDFGAGFSSFKYIKELPVDLIKIDGSFVKDLHNDPVSEIMIKSLNDIAQVTHKKTVAEWVESKDVLDTLQDMGVDYGQGYFLGHPMPLEEFMERVK